MLCHMGGWGMVAGTWPTSHRTCSQLTQPPGIIDNSGVGAVEQTSSKNYAFTHQKLIWWGLQHYGWCLSTWVLEELSEACMRNMGGVCQLDVWKNCQRMAWEIYVVSVNWMFGRLVRGKHEKSDQPNCPTSWDYLGLVGHGMRPTIV